MFYHFVLTLDLSDFHLALCLCWAVCAPALASASRRRLSTSTRCHSGAAIHRRLSCDPVIALPLIHRHNPTCHTSCPTSLSVTPLFNNADNDTEQDHAWTSYNSSKSAVLQMARSMACELGPRRIRVNSLSPGHIYTKCVVCLFYSFLFVTFDGFGVGEQVGRRRSVARRSSRTLLA